MNYFAHGRRYVQDAYFLAGTAVPDWLNVVDRRVRVRSKAAQPFIDDPDPKLAALARGIVQHHDDDQWFHQTRAFAELSLGFTLEIRELLKPDDGFRPSFLGHILVELLLDAALIEQDPKLLDQYYAAIDTVDPLIVTRAVVRMSGKEVNLIPWIPRFSAERFLYDYLDDAKLLTRLNHVMRRVSLPGLPPTLQGFFGPARKAVRERQTELLTGQR
jgi:hypothetical protein